MFITWWMIVLVILVLFSIYYLAQKLDKTKKEIEGLKEKVATDEDLKNIMSDIYLIQDRLKKVEDGSDDYK